MQTTTPDHPTGSMAHAYQAFLELRPDLEHRFPTYLVWICSKAPEPVSFRQGWAARGMTQTVHPPIPGGWRSINDLPPEADDDEEWDNRCVVTWIDAENQSDIGAEVTNLHFIRQGDFHHPRQLLAHWRSILDAPAFSEPQEDEDDDL